VIQATGAGTLPRERINASLSDVRRVSPIDHVGVSAYHRRQAVARGGGEEEEGNETQTTDRSDRDDSTNADTNHRRQR
jgi:hypothetical protein